LNESDCFTRRLVRNDKTLVVISSDALGAKQSQNSTYGTIERLQNIP